jgi:hypothetical protein
VALGLLFGQGHRVLVHSHVGEGGQACNDVGGCLHQGDLGRRTQEGRDPTLGPGSNSQAIKGDLGNSGRRDHLGGAGSSSQV